MSLERLVLITGLVGNVLSIGLSAYAIWLIRSTIIANIKREIDKL
ncbi:MAG: hypothetical protein BWY85_00014 [Firmicutes bacterium ADurb.Bin506]|nr:MAG: hypothetical protein BWY85_00014 [Firmicutes bacterium ADurb.Bin506]